jgi:hypothetical protein
MLALGIIVFLNLLCIISYLLLIVLLAERMSDRIFLYQKHSKKKKKSQVQWLTPIILAIPKADIRRISV